MSKVTLRIPIPASAQEGPAGNPLAFQGDTIEVDSSVIRAAGFVPREELEECQRALDERSQSNVAEYRAIANDAAKIAARLSEGRIAALEKVAEAARIVMALNTAESGEQSYDMRTAVCSLQDRIEEIGSLRELDALDSGAPGHLEIIGKVADSLPTNEEDERAIDALVSKATAGRVERRFGKGPAR